MLKNCLSHHKFHVTHLTILFPISKKQYKILIYKNLQKNCKEYYYYCIVYCMIYGQNIIKHDHNRYKTVHYLDVLKTITN